MNGVELAVASLEALTLTELRQRWCEVSSDPVPRLSANMLRLALAWEMQAQVHGGLSRRCQQQLEQAVNGQTVTRQSSPGMRLVRE